MWERIRPWLFPVSCLGCNVPGIALCAVCRPGPADRTSDTIAGVALLAAGEYARLLRHAIVRMKHGERAFLEPFAEVLAAITPAGVALVPLPTSRRRAAARGFDQSVELARRVALARDTVCADVLEKRGLAQRGLARQARLDAGGRFRLKARVTLPDCAIVIDDVCTTGATLTDGIVTLRAAGVAVIGAAVLARTEAGRNSPMQRAVVAHGYHHR